MEDNKISQNQAYVFICNLFLFLWPKVELKVKATGTGFPNLFTVKFLESILNLV